MTRLPSVLAPYPGEWLGFWLHRVAVQYGLDLERLLLHLGLASPKGPRVTWGRFVDFGVSEVQIVAAALGEHPLRLRAMQRRISANGPHAQLGYCASCLRDDRSKGRPLHWRRDWMDPYVTYCERHRVLLAPIDASVIRPCRTARATESVLDELAAAIVVCDISGTEPAFAAIDALLRGLRRERRVNGPRDPMALRRFVDQIAMNATPAVEVSLGSGTDVSPPSRPMFIWTRGPVAAVHSRRCDRCVNGRLHFG